MAAIIASLPPLVITGLVLAGGRAERMGGSDKGLIPYLEKPLIETALTRLQDQVSTILINANRNHMRYASYGYPVIADDSAVESAPSYFGPLAGFMAGLRHCQTEYLLTVPCDSPLFPLDLGARLSAELLRGPFDLVYACSIDNTGHQWNQAVFCLMKKTVQLSLSEFLASGARKIDRWFENVNSSAVLFENEQAFANANTPAELASLETLAHLEKQNKIAVQSQIKT